MKGDTLLISIRCVYQVISLILNRCGVAYFPKP